MNEGMHIHLVRGGWMGWAGIQVYWAMFTLRRCTLRFNWLEYLTTINASAFNRFSPGGQA